jgi:hypothetical protein
MYPANEVLNKSHRLTVSHCDSQDEDKLRLRKITCTLFEQAVIMAAANRQFNDVKWLRSQKGKDILTVDDYLFDHSESEVQGMICCFVHVDLKEIFVSGCFNLVQSNGLISHVMSFRETSVV